MASKMIKNNGIDIGKMGTRPRLICYYGYIGYMVILSH